jgi:hypothetical protein
MLGIAVEKVCDLVLRAEAFDAKVPVIEPDPGSDVIDDKWAEVLEDYSDDPTLDEMRAFIQGLNMEEQINLVALVWLGREDYGPDDWEDLLQQAREAHNDHTDEYLIGIPLLGTFLEEGLSQLGYSCE